MESKEDTTGNMSGYEVNAIRWLPEVLVGAQLVLGYLEVEGFASR